MTESQERLLREAETHWDATGIIADLARELRLALAEGEKAQRTLDKYLKWCRCGVTHALGATVIGDDAALAARSGAGHE